MRHHRWVVLAGGFLAYLFDALELLLLALALPAIRADLGLTAGQGGLLATATLLGIGVSSVVVGHVADNVGRRTALVGSLVVAGTCTAVTAAVGGFEEFLVLRFVAGIGLGGVWSVLCAYLTETWPAASRGRATAFMLSSFPVGGMVAAVLSGLFLPDWRTLFLVAGTAMVVPVLIVVLLFAESEQWRTQRAAARDSDTERVSVVEILRPGLRARTLLATAVAALALTASWGALTWLPSYLTVERGLEAGTVGTYMVLLNLGMFVGYNAFGLLADRLGRREAITVSLLGVGVTLPLYAVASDHTALLWLGPLFAFFAAFNGIVGSYFPELFATRVRATGAGFCFNVGRGVSALAPLALGALVVLVGFSGGLLICAAIFVVAGALSLLLPRRPELARRSARASGPSSGAGPGDVVPALGVDGELDEIAVRVADVGAAHRAEYAGAVDGPGLDVVAGRTF